ncbi:ATP-binding protein [Alteromonas sp. H39]|uniref:ATP-binding protein n=1 Tax=Alteromonas sp. H39 TaxID=3389876 RepID=UPI0039E0860E
MAFFTNVSFFIVIVAQIFNFAKASSFSEFGTVRFKGTTTGIIRDIETIDGELYLGAENGLFSVVGASSKVFDHKTSLLGNGIISDLSKSDSGGLWIAEYGSGVHYFEPSTYTLSTIESSHPKVKYVWSVEETEHYLIASTITGLLVFDKQSKRVVSEIANIAGKPLEGIYSLTKGPDDTIYFVSEDIVYALDTSLNARKLNTDDGLQQFDKLSKISLIEYIDSAFYVAGPEGIYSVENGEIEFFPIADGVILPYGIEFIYKDRSGNLWLAGGGVFKLNAQEGEIVKPEFMDPFLSSSAIESITSISETANGEMVFASSQKGLIVIPKVSTSFNYISEAGKPFYGNIKDVKILEGDVNIKTQDGVYRLDTKNGSIIKNAVDFEQFDCVAAKSMLQYDESESETTKKTLCENDIINSFSILGGAFFYIQAAERKELVEIRDGKVVDVYEAPGKISSLLLTHENDLIVATDEAKLYIQHSRATWKEVSLSNKNLSQINCLIDGLEDVVWICTSGNGVLALDLSDYKISFEPTSELGAARFVRGGIRLDKETLLFTTNRGAFVFNERNKIAQSIDASDGIVDVDFEYRGIYEVDKSNIVVVGDRYSYIVNKRRFLKTLEEKRNRKSHVEILDVTAVGGSDQPFLLGASLNEGNSSITTRRLIERISIKLASSNYTARFDQKVEYRMLGLFEEWRKLEGSTGNVIFDSIDSGEYIFQSRVVDPHSILKQPISSLKIEIKTPPFLSWYAFYIYAFIVLAIAYLFRGKYRHKLSGAFRTILVKNNKKEEALSERLTLLKRNITKKQKMFSDIAHEIKSPVMLIREPLKEIRDNPKDDKANKKRIEIALNQAQMLQCLVNQIIQIERLESVTKLPRKPIQVKECIEGLCIQMQALTDSKSQVLDVKVNGDAVLILIEDSLEKIVSNLIANASKYSDAKTTIRVRVKIDEEKVIIRVADEGVGINESDFESVFQRFSQLHKVNEEGTGIGLAMVRELARVNGGDVELKSKEGEGSAFTVTLPVTCSEIATSSEVEWVPVTESNRDDTAEEQTDSEVHDKGKPLILIVDDSRDMRFYLCNLLEPHYTCVTARNGQHAIDVLQVYQPDVIISDLEMPNLNGIELAKYLKESEALSLIPFIMLTAHEDKELRSSAWEQEITDVISKPFHGDELLVKVRNILSNRSKISEHIEHNQSQSSLAENEAKDIPQFANRKDMEFYTNFLAVVEKNYHNEKWGRADAASALLISERQLNRKVSDLFGSSFSEFLRNHRLNKAGDRLANGEQITHVAYGVGFGTPSYFSSCFKQKFGKSPKGYQDDALEKASVVG